MRKKRKQSVPLIIEKHPFDYEGYPFITLIQFRQEHLLTIIDNVSDKEIRAFVLDMCGPENIDEEQVISIANEWYETNKDRYPLSFEFSRREITNLISPIYRKFSIDYVSRIIGPLFKFPMDSTEKVKRKRKKTLPLNIQVSKKITT